MMLCAPPLRICCARAMCSMRFISRISRGSLRPARVSVDTRCACNESIGISTLDFSLPTTFDERSRIGWFCSRPARGCESLQDAGLGLLLEVEPSVRFREGDVPRQRLIASALVSVHLFPEPRGGRGVDLSTIQIQPRASGTEAL